MIKIHNLLQLVIGNRETIRRSGVSGAISAVIMVMLFITFFGTTADDLGSENIFSFSGAPGDLGVLCIPGFIFLAFASLGGRAIGWLFIRPVAVILSKAAPSWSIRQLWAISAASVWVMISFLSVLPYFPQIRSGFTAVAFMTLLLGAVAAGIAGGRYGAKTTLDKTRKESREYWFIGGMVTGSCLIVLQALANLIRLPLVTTWQTNAFIEFCISLTMASFVATIPYVFVMLLSLILVRIGPLAEKSHLVYGLASGIIWSGIGYFFFAGTIMEDRIMEKVVTSAVVGLCGAAGGWSIAEFKAD